MKINNFFLVILFLSLNGFSQLQILGRETTQLATWDLTRKIDPNAKVDNISGTPYSETEFFNAQIKISDTLITAPVRYNVVLDEMEFKRDDQVYALVVKDFVTVNMNLSKKTYHFVEYTYNNVTKKGFLIKNTENKKVNLFTKEVIEYVPYKDAPNAYSQPTPPQYKRKNDVYLLENQKSIVAMPSKKKELLALFPDHVNQIEAFIKTNKIGLKEVDDLIMLVNFLNTL